MTFGQSISTCISKYVTFTGRASRSEYWWWQLFLLICYIGVGIIGGVLIGIIGGKSLLLGASPISSLAAMTPLLACTGIFCLLVILPSLAVLIRRLHDSGHSGWWILLSFIPNIIYSVSNTYMVANAATAATNAVGGMIVSIIFGIAGFIGGIVILVFTLQASQPMANRYGEVPAGVYNQHC